MAVIGIALLAAVTIAQATMTSQPGTPPRPYLGSTYSAGAQFRNREGRSSATGACRAASESTSGSTTWWRSGGIDARTFGRLPPNRGQFDRLQACHGSPAPGGYGFRGRLIAGAAGHALLPRACRAVHRQPTSPQEKLLMLGPWDTTAPIYLQPGAGLDVAIRPGPPGRGRPTSSRATCHNAPRASVGALPSSEEVRLGPQTGDECNCDESAIARAAWAPGTTCMTRSRTPRPAPCGCMMSRSRAWPPA